jgi:hypothetical protein
VLANDTFNPFALAISHLLSEQAAGAASVSPDSVGGFGTWQPSVVVPSGPINANAWMLEYSPPPGFVGTDSFQYCIGSFAAPARRPARPSSSRSRRRPRRSRPSAASRSPDCPGVLGWLGLRLRRRG